MSGKVVGVNPGAEAVIVMVCDPGEIGLIQFVSKFAPETEKFGLSTENVTLGTGAPLEIAVNV